MKTTKPRRRFALLVGLLAPLVSPLVNAQVSLPFEPFRPDDIANSDLQYIHITGSIIDLGDGVRITITNNSVSGDGWVTDTRPTVASVFFDWDSSIATSDPIISSSSSGVNMVTGGAPPNLPGGNEIGFESDYRFTAAPPRPKNGLDPGEFISFDFAGADYEAVLASVVNADLRIGVHILEVGENGEDSVSLVMIPEPSSVLLGGLGLLALLRRKK